MRFPGQIACVGLAFLAGCATTAKQKSRFAEPNALMGEEIQNRIAEIPYQHREELFNNLLWLANAGEPAIPALLKALHHSEPKVRSSAIWVLAEIGDRRVIPDLQPLASDANYTVRLEASRSLMLLGDLKYAPALIEALDSDKVQVRYLCHEALKIATGRDFGYDHLSDDLGQRHKTVLAWRRWWTSMSDDAKFAQSYAQRYGLVAAPMGGGEAAPPAAPLQEGPGAAQVDLTGGHAPAPQGESAGGPQPPVTEPPTQTPPTQTPPTQTPPTPATRTPAPAPEHKPEAPAQPPAHTGSATIDFGAPAARKPGH